MHSDVESTVRERVRAKGLLTFSEFMEMALYAPGIGYYARPGVDPKQDFYTSPSIHPAFGALLALQLEQLWRRLGSPRPFTVVEPGAGNGLLAASMLDFAKLATPELYTSLRYVAIDRATAAPESLAGRPVQWLASSGLPLEPFAGCVIANELLDAFPAHRLTWQQGRLLEVYVGLRDGELADVQDEPSSPAFERWIQREEVTPLEGTRWEVALGLELWFAELGRKLQRGYVLLVDYGHVAESLFGALRSHGTLKCFYRHQQLDDPYQRIGLQDLTYQVDFSMAILAAQDAGFKVEALTVQRKFLANLGMSAFMERLERRGLPQRQRDANAMALHALMAPADLGNFKVLALSKGMPVLPIAGLQGDPAWLVQVRERLACVELPLLGKQHLSLLKGRYPYQDLDIERMWAAATGQEE